MNPRLVLVHDCACVCMVSIVIINVCAFPVQCCVDFECGYSSEEEGGLCHTPALLCANIL